MTSQPVPVSGLATPLRFAALVALALAATAGLMIADFGFTAKALGPPLQVTARLALVLFAAAFATAALPALKRFHPSLALAFVACHVVHLALILARASLVVMTRPGFDSSRDPFLQHPAVSAVQVPDIEIASRDIRKRLQEGLWDRACRS